MEDDKETIKFGAAYVRVSTDDQLEYSPDSQLRLIREYAKREGYVVPDEFVFQDDGISGSKAEKRPAFMLMVAKAKEKDPPFDTIFVWKFSRFARNQEESLVYKNLLKKNGVTVRSVSEPSSEDNPFSGLIESVISWMDEYYLTNLSSEVKRGMKEKATRGEAMGRAPYGYVVKDKVLVPDPATAPNVLFIFEQFAQGKSFRQVAIECEAAGIRPRSGKPFDSYCLRYVLRNPAYIGKIRWASNGDHAVYRGAKYALDQQDIYEGKHEPIIPVELWDAVQKRLPKAEAEEVKYVRRGKPIFYMSKGLVRCDSCGATMIRVTNPKRKSERLQCYKYSRGQCKVSHSITMPKLDAAIIRGLEEAIASETFIFSPKPPQQSSSGVKKDWIKLIQSEQNRLERAKNAMLDGALSIAEYKEVKAAAEANIEKLREADEKERQTESAAPNDIELYKERVLGVLDVLKSSTATAEAKNSALRSIVDKIVYKKDPPTLDFFYI